MSQRYEIDSPNEQIYKKLIFEIMPNNFIKIINNFTSPKRIVPFKEVSRDIKP